MPETTLRDYARAAHRRPSPDFTAIESLLQRGFRYVACEEDGEFCLPTCGNIATALDLPGYHGLHSLTEARAQSLAPCRTCRPVAA
jgi:hypothetical protein